MKLVGANAVLSLLVECSLALHETTTAHYGVHNSSFIHAFVSGMHHYECIAPNVDIRVDSSLR